MGKKLLNYNTFKSILESEFSENFPIIIESNLLECILLTEYFTLEEKGYINKNILFFNNGLDLSSLNEGFLDSFKKKIKNAADDLGGAVVAKLDKLGDSIQKVTSAIVDSIKKVWDEALNYMKAQFSRHKDQVIEKLKEKGKEWSEKLVEELKGLKETLHFWLNTFITKLSSGFGSGFQSEVKESVSFEDINEELNNILILLNESEEGKGGGYISKAIHALGHKPPFSWLHNLQTKYKVAIGTGLNKFSEITKDFGGPGVYEFAAIALVAATFAELKSKDLIKGFVVKPIFTVLLGPIGGTIVSVASYVAMVITVYETAEALIKMSGGDEPATDHEEEAHH